MVLVRRFAVDHAGSYNLTSKHRSDDNEINSQSNRVRQHYQQSMYMIMMCFAISDKRMHLPRIYPAPQ